MGHAKVKMGVFTYEDSVAENKEIQTETWSYTHSPEDIQDSTHNFELA